MTNEDKKGFIFYLSFYEAIKDLESKEKLELFEAICELALYDNEIELSGISNTLFKLIKPQLLANNKKYTDGKKGGRPKKETSAYENKETSGYGKNKAKDKVKDKDKDKDKVNKEINISKDILIENGNSQSPKNQDLEIDKLLIYLKKSIGIETFKDSQTWERKYGKNLLELMYKIGKDEFKKRLESILKDKFKKQNCNGLKFLYGEISAFIQNPDIEEDKEFKLIIEKSGLTKNKQKEANIIISQRKFDKKIITKGVIERIIETLRNKI